jgi:hypothetical protein
MGRKNLAAVLAPVLLFSSVCMGQTLTLPDDLVSIDSGDVPSPVYAYWSIANWNIWAPTPDNFSPGSPLYYSPSDTFSNHVIYIDDTGGSFHAMDEPSGGDGGGDGGGDPPGPQPTSTNLWLYLSHPDTNRNATLTISNTVTGNPYDVIVSPVVTNALPTWASAGIWIGASGNTTPIYPVELPTNAAFYFDARLWALGRFSNSVPTGGEILLILSNTNSIQAVVNGVSNTYAPFYSNYVLLEPPLYSVNVGYDSSDSGSSNTTTYLTLTNQHIMGVAGYSTTLTINRSIIYFTHRRNDDSFCA